MSGLNLGKQPPESKEPTETKTQETANEMVQTTQSEGDMVYARWSSHPIQRYTVGEFQFENGLLVLTSEVDAEKFQETFDSLPIYEQSRIKKIDLAAAEELVRQRLLGGGATKNIDSSVGDRAPNNAVGEGDLLANQTAANTQIIQ